MKLLIGLLSLTSLVAQTRVDLHAFGVPDIASAPSLFYTCIDKSTVPNVVLCDLPGFVLTKGVTLVVFANQDSNDITVSINGISAFHREGGGFSATDILAGRLPTIFTFDGFVWREPYARLVAGFSGLLATDYSHPGPTIDTTADVPCIPCANFWKGANDFSQAAAFKVPAGIVQGGMVMFEEVPSGVLDGSNQAFQLTHVPMAVQLYVNGIRQKNGVDFTVTSNTINFVAGAIPQVGDIIMADYTWSGQ